ncbi:MAG: acetyltransferase [Gammaproteobacteria bacterium RIFCSPHIGHO2_12_FULL_38_11]|nr:MAG: acetyltransferase [Gammaproteobacteria bacterium RIFCSPHIGHO2_12_FULL_38_11]
MSDLIKKIIIEGITESGETFRPSDWAERMSGQLSTFHKRRIHYSPLLQPSVKDGRKCVLLDEKLKETNPELYQSILDFAHENHLKICDKED